jgi:superfamily I DNA and/or RNA helicase
VVLATLAGAGDEALDVLGGLDIAVVDEAAQATEPAAWLALLRARRAVLAGDSKQLPPTILSQEAAAQVQICC